MSAALSTLESAQVLSLQNSAQEHLIDPFYPYHVYASPSPSQIPVKDASLGILFNYPIAVIKSIKRPEGSE